MSRPALAPVDGANTAHRSCKTTMSISTAASASPAPGPIDQPPPRLLAHASGRLVLLASVLLLAGLGGILPPRVWAPYRQGGSRRRRDTPQQVHMRAADTPRS